MATSITSLADAVRWSWLFCAVVLGCSQVPAQDSRPNTAPPDSPVRAAPKPIAQPSAPAIVASSEPERSIQILAFDCYKPEDTGAGRSVPTSSLVSQWQAGGPSGASWNVSDLRCYADLAAKCSRGEIDARLFVGERSVVETKLGVNRSGAQHLEFEVTEKNWKARPRRGAQAAASLSHGVVYPASRRFMRGARGIQRRDQSVSRSRRCSKFHRRLRER
jgi:hypothetical protein